MRVRMKVNEFAHTTHACLSEAPGEGGAKEGGMRLSISSSFGRLPSVEGRIPMQIFMNLRWRWQVWKNRRRHPDLIELEKLDGDPTLIAQQMMMRDRDTVRAKGIHPPDPRYPSLWDYRYFPPQSLFRRFIHWWYCKRRWFFPR